MEHRNFEVEVIIYFRDQVSYLRTLYLGLTSHQQSPRTYSEYLSEALAYRAIRWHEWVHMLDYRALLSRLPTATRIIARPFRPQSSVIGDFVSILGLTTSDLNMDPNFRANAQDQSVWPSLDYIAIARGETSESITSKQCEKFRAPLTTAKSISASPASEGS